jgi:hypothetical protein
MPGCTTAWLWAKDSVSQQGIEWEDDMVEVKSAKHGRDHA